MSDINILLLRIKYALESMDDNNQLEAVEYIETLAAGAWAYEDKLGENDVRSIN